eukprot:3774172-Rhodomonas_salina.4
MAREVGGGGPGKGSLAEREALEELELAEPVGEAFQRVVVEAERRQRRRDCADSRRKQPEVHRGQVEEPRMRTLLDPTQVPDNRAPAGLDDVSGHPAHVRERDCDLFEEGEIAKLQRQLSDLVSGDAEGLETREGQDDRREHRQEVVLEVQERE